jgi:hypothetical protein
MRNPGNIVATAALTAMFLALPACSTGSKRAPSDLDRKLSQSSYVEEGKLMALIVGTRVTRQREERPYIPFEVAVVNKALASISFTAESFTLVDSEGNRYSTVGFDELRNDYGNVDIDRRLEEVAPTVRGTYQAYEEIPSSLTGSFDRPIVQKMFLPKFSYMVDMIYFPTPAGGVKGKRFELFLNAPELQDPVFVKFEVAR